jgi:penicillin amidase
MKTLKIILISFLILVIAVIIAGLVIVTGINRGALPKYNGKIFLSGLSGEVTVYRDERGMPHIYANNEHDLYFAVGYVMSQERLFQMDLIRRVTTGRLSELIGEKLVQYDLFNRSLDMTSKSKTVLSTTDPGILSCLQAFADGVNKFITEAGNKLPPEFKILRYRPDPWKLEDIANIIGYMGWDLASDPVLYLMGFFEVERAGRAAQFTKAELDRLFSRNFHVRHRRIFQRQEESLV